MSITLTVNSFTPHHSLNPLHLTSHSHYGISTCQLYLLYSPPTLIQTTPRISLITRSPCFTHSNHHHTKNAMSETEKTAAQIAREKRQARIKQKAAERMAKITSTVRPTGFDDDADKVVGKENESTIGGGAGNTDAAAPGVSTATGPTHTVGVASSPATSATSATMSAPVVVDSEDPPDVDISVDSHHHLPTARNREDPFGSLAMQSAGPDSDDPFAAMLQQMLGGEGGQGMPGMGMGQGMGGQPGEGGEPDLSKLMSMMMGGEGGPGGAGAEGNPFAAMGGLGSMMGGAQGAQGGPQMATPSSSPKKNLFWTILHALTAILIGLYTVVVFGHKWTHFEPYFDSLHAVKPLILFISVQLVLQTARLVQDKGRLPPDSMLLQLASFVPQPYRGYIESGSRLYKTFNLAKSDFFVVLFVYGLSTIV